MAGSYNALMEERRRKQLEESRARGDAKYAEIQGAQAKQLNDPMASLAKGDKTIATNNMAALKQDMAVLNNDNSKIEDVVASRARVAAAMQDPSMQQPGMSGSQAAAGFGAASQVAQAAGPQSGAAGAGQGALAGAAGGASLGALSGPQGALAGAAIGAAVGTTGALLQQRAAKKAKKREAQAELYQMQGQIEAQTEEKRQAAYKGMMDSLRTAFIWS